LVPDLVKIVGEAPVEEADWLLGAESVGKNAPGFVPSVDPPV